MRLPRGIRRVFSLESSHTPSRDDVSGELEFHLAMRTQELIDRGLEPERARREAARLLGDTGRIASALLRDAQKARPRRLLSSWIAELRQDLSFALRTLRSAPGYTLAAVTTLGLGIGANTAVFTLVDGVLTSPLPYRHADRLVTLWSTSPSRGLFTRSPVSYPDFRDWRAQATSFSGMAMMYGGDAVLRQREGPTPIVVAAVSGDYFDVLGGSAVLGAPFNQRDADANAQVAVLKYGTWQRRYGGDPNIIGRTIGLDEMSYTIVGVMDRGRDFPAWGELWIPLSPEIIARNNLEHRGQRIDTWVLARLRPGVDSSAAVAELQTIAARLEQAYPATNTDWSVLVAPLRQIVIDPFGRNATLPRAMLLLNGAVGLVLLIACANVANLSLARLLFRRRELAVRMSLGAGRWRMIRQLLTESLVVSLAGAVLGVIVANWAVRFILAHGPALPRGSEIAVDVRVLTFTALLVAATTVAFGILPALRGGRAKAVDLREGTQRVTGRPRGRHLQSALVASQVGMALVLLVGAGLLLRSLVQLQSLDPGFDPEHLLVLRASAPSPPYSTDEQLIALHRTLERKLESVPGVTGAATVNHVPGGGMVISPLETQALDTTLSAVLRTASPDYVETMGIAVLEGRGLRESDADPWNGALLINQRLADIIQQPLGKRLTVFKQKPGADFGTALDGTVVGVVGDVRGSLAQGSSPFTVYVPDTQNPWQRATLVVRTDPAVTDPVTLVRRAILAADPNLPVSGLHTMEAQLQSSLAQQRFAVLLMSTFAGAAIFLAALGIYAVLAYTVRLRTREIGVRIALGANRGAVVGLVVRHTMAIVALGGAVGTVAAVALTGLMGTLLVGVEPLDPVTYATGAGTLVLVAFTAGYLPARRAANLDPMEVLREE